MCEEGFQVNSLELVSAFLLSLSFLALSKVKVFVCLIRIPQPQNFTTSISNECICS